MESHLRTARVLAHLFDSQFGFGEFRFGIASLLDLVPGIGDFLAAAISFYIVWLGIQMGLPGYRILQMIFNVLLDFFIGLIPVVGDIGYLFYKANLRNLAILEKYANKKSNVIKGRYASA